ncbi:MAG TPA: O-antigen ligase family protein [Chitinophagaceae bacterium]|nr:O-antigen ligase family protein [Chitinophagaceae bacterium]
MTGDVPHRSSKHFVVLAVVFLTSATVAVITSLYWLLFVPFGFLLFYAGWQQWQIVFYLLIFFLPWSIEFSFSSSLATDLPDEPIMWLTTLLFFAYFLFTPSEIFSKAKHPLVILLLCSLAWIIVTVFFSTDWLISLKFLLAKSWYMVAFVFAPLLFFVNKRTIAGVAIVFFASMLLVTMISLCRHSLYGFRFANVNDAISPFFRNHVNYSAMLVCTVPVLTAFYQLNKKYRSIVIAAMVIVLVALFFSFSRGAWLAFVIGLLSYWLIQKRKLLIAFVIVIVLTISSMFWLSSNDRYLHYAHDYRTTIFHKNFQEHLIATYKLKDVSTAERFNRWIAGVRMIKDNWLTGIGPNTFYYNYKPYAIPAFRTWVSDNKEHSTIHNYFLFVLIEQGVPGLLLFLFIIGAMIYYAEKIYHHTEDKFYKATALACGVLTMMIVAVNFLSDLIETDKVGSLFFLCLAILVSIDLKTRSQPRPTGIF